MKALKNRSLFIQYLISYLGVAVLALTVIGLIFISIYINDLESQQKQELQDKAGIVINDMEDQFNVFYNISLNISTQKLYWPSHFRSNKYYEIDLLNDFTQYKFHSSISSEYFLFYKDSDTIFHSSGTTKSFSAYMQSLDIQKDLSVISDSLNTAKAFDVIVFDDQKLLFVLFPVSTDSDSNATLCFIIYNTDLHSRFQSITGGLDGDYSIYYRNNLIAASANNKITSKGVKILKIYSQNGVWFLLLDYSDSLHGLSNFKVLNICLLVCSILLIFTLSAYVAYKNYKPIQRVASKYALDSMHNNLLGNKNELLEIDTLFQQFLDNASLANARLENQQMFMRKQMLHLMLNGGFTSEMGSHLQSINLSLPGPYYCVLVVYLQTADIFYSKDMLPNKNMYELLNLIEDLSDEEMLFYPVKDNGHMRIVILLSLSEAWQREDAAGMVRELFAAKDYAFSLGTGNIYNTVTRFPASYMDALSDIKNTGSPVNTAELETADDTTLNSSLCYDTAAITQMLLSIKQGDQEKAQQYLGSFAADLKQKEPSFLVLRYIFSDILSKLVHTGMETENPVSEQKISTIVTANNINEFHEGVSLILTDLCSKVRSNIDRLNRDTAYKVILYIKQNFMDYDMTVEKIAKDLNLGINRVSYIIRQETCKTYKDYIIDLRINHAKGLLQSTKFTVAEICTQIGYLNISHFIKSFKNRVGETPAVFRKKAISTEK